MAAEDHQHHGQQEEEGHDPQNHEAVTYKHCEMAEKPRRAGPCQHHLQPAHPARHAIFAALSIFLLLAGVTALVLWLVYRPEKPHFNVAAAAAYALATTANPASQPPSVTAALQFTVVARNPNRRATAYLDRLSAHVAYRDEPLTHPASLPPLVLTRRGAVAMSPVLGGGEAVQVSAAAAVGLAADAGTYGVVGMRVVLQGRLRWKAGPVRTAHYGFYVTCDVVLGLRRGVVGQLPLLRSPPCKVDI